MTYVDVNKNTTFLTSHGVYRLLYNSKKQEAKKSLENGQKNILMI
jgi:prophage antirepressor-like protein